MIQIFKDIFFKSLFWFLQISALSHILWVVFSYSCVQINKYFHLIYFINVSGGKYVYCCAG